MGSIKIWLQAFRARTLPLAIAGTFLGSFLAYSEGFFSLPVFIFSALTSLFLQILSNLANDYGDYIKGVDTIERKGPERVTVSGKVTKTGMKRMIISFVILSFISGILLIYYGTINKPVVAKVLFLVLGVIAILASLKYTLGKNPYGYIGLGDLFVFIFFGIVSVAGTFYLHGHYLNFNILLPSSVIGLLSVGVLNLNNLRDRDTDIKTGKRTIIVLIGNKWGKVYHILLVTFAITLSIIYVILTYHSIFQFLFLLIVPFFILNILNVLKKVQSDLLNKQLKLLAFLTFIFSILFGIGQII